MADEKLKMATKGELDCPPGLGIRHLQIITMGICATIIYVLRSSMGAAILSMTDTSLPTNNTGYEVYDWSEEIQGIILSSFFWGYTVMQIPAGILCKHYGAKPLLLTTLLVNGVLALLTPTLAKVGGWISVTVIRVIMGLSQACFMPAEHTLLGRWAPPRERTRLSILAYAGIQVGTILTMPICGLLSNTYLGWVSIFYSMGVLALATSVFWWGFAASTPRQHRFISEREVEYIEQSLSSKEENYAIPWRHILTSVPLIATAFAHIGANWCFIIFLVQVPTYLKNALDINIKNSTTLSALPFLANWIVSFGSSMLSDFMINRKILSTTNTRKLFNSIGSFGCFLGLVAMSFITKEHKVYAILVLVLTVGLLGCNNCGYMMNHLDLSPRFGGVMFGITNCIANLLGLIGPLSAGFILGDHGTDLARWRIVFFIAGSIVIVSDVIYRIFASSEIQHWNEPQDTTKYELGLIRKKNSLMNSLTRSRDERILMNSLTHSKDEKVLMASLTQSKDERVYSFVDKV